MTQNFDGRVALITGAAAGIGRAIALRLVDQGALVVGVDRDADGLARMSAEAGHRFDAVEADISDPASCRGVVEQAVRAHGQLDILGNVAGIARAEHLADVSVEQYRRMMAVNTDACFFLSQAAMPHLIASQGVLISIASTAGLVGQAYTVPYCMSKAAVIQMTRALAMEFLKTQVRINAIAPGGIMTPLVQGFSAPPDMDMELAGRYRAIRGIGVAEDVAALFTFLASDEAKNIHGAVISTDGGATAG